MTRQKFINIYAEASPNPNSLKFVLNFNLLENGNVDFPRIEDTENCPLARALFQQFKYIQRVFIASNFVTITKSESLDWYEIQNEIRGFLREYFVAEKIVFTEEISKNAEKIQSDSVGNELEERIKTVLNDYVRPAVENDGGAITFHSFEEGVVKVLLQGACSGCPSSTQTLKSGIENLLTNMIPQVKEVIAEGV